MKLGEWLEAEGVEVAQFAARIDRTPEAVRRYVAGVRIPDKDTMPLIVRETNHNVTPNDFYQLSVAA